MTTFLILINNATKMGLYHLALGNYLKSKGKKIVYAFCDRLPVYIDHLNIENEHCYFFSDYFKDHYDIRTYSEKYRHINLNKCFYSDYDRLIVFSHGKYAGDDFYNSLMPNLVNFFDLILSENNVDICLNESVANSFSYVAFEVMKASNVHYCGYAGCRLKGRFELYTEEFGCVSHFAELFNQTNLNSIPKEELDSIDAYLKEYSIGTLLPSYHPKNTVLDWNFPLLKRVFNSNTIQRICGCVKFVFNEHNDIKYSYMSRHVVRELFIGFGNHMRKLFRAKFAQRYFDNIDYTEKFFLYPQHFKPEASTSVLARHYCNDIAVIENIAFNLPFGTKLYVKEHFVNFGRMPISYYKRLKQIPNVHLIRCNENTKELIAHSQGVITLTSTVGFEALLMNKPVWIFGNVFYESHPNCRKLNGFLELFDQLNDTSIYDDTENINRRFVYAYRKSSYIGNIYYGLGTVNYTIDMFVEPFVAAVNERFGQ